MSPENLVSNSASNSAFVGTSTAPIPAGTLETLLNQDQNNNQNSYYFLCWPHTTSGIITKLPQQLSPEGRMFNAELELRWKRQGEGYDLLLLSSVGGWKAFEPLDGDWRCCDRSASLYPKTETRFSGRLRYPQGIEFGQRYFFDAQTATVHFVALTPTVQAKPSNEDPNDPASPEPTQAAA